MSEAAFLFWLIVGGVVVYLLFNVLMGMAVMGAMPPIYRAMDDKEDER